MVNTSGDFVKLKFTPGIFRDITQYSAEGMYVDCDKVRFLEGQPQVLGGWVRNPLDVSINGVERALHTWSTLDGEKYTAIGTNTKLYVVNGGNLYDITPVETSGVYTSIFSVSLDATTVLASITSHNRQAGDSFIIETSTTIGGDIVLFGEYVVTSVPSANTFQFEVPSSATVSTADAGASTSIDFLLGIGLESNATLFGWGGGTWGTPGLGGDGWGTPRDSGIRGELRLWSLDNWGEDLVACPRGGRIYRWDSSQGTSVRAVVISTSPSANSFIKVGQPTRNLISFGCTNTLGVFDRMNIRWTDTENLDNWAVTSGSDAGEFRLPNGSLIIGAEESKKEILILTDDAAVTMRYVGGQYIYGFNEVARNINLVGQNAAIQANGIVYLMTTEGFYAYDGIVKPMLCTMHNFIFATSGSDGYLNFDQKEKTYAGINTEFHEVAWFYPADGSSENNRYVIYNYLENCWYDGSITRTAWEDSGLNPKPIATANNGLIYSHEIGYSDDSNAMDKYIETGYTDIKDGKDLLFVDTLIPDYLPEENLNVNMTVYTKKYPADPNIVVKGPFAVNSSTQKVSMRARGRQMKLRYSTSTTNGYFRVGDVRVNVKPDGGR
jgi:hypothetical protein